MPAATEANHPTWARLQDTLMLLGRVLIAFLFVPDGFGILTNFAGTVSYISSAGLALPQLGAVLAIIAQLGFGLALLVGYMTRWVALGLAIFCVATAFLFHNFWTFPEAQKMAMKIQFGKNMAIAGGLLAFSAFGAGRFSIDKR